MFRNLPQPRARIWDFCFFKITLGPFFLWLLNSREFPACISLIFFLPFPSFASAIPFCLQARSSAAARGPVSLSSGVTRAAAWSCQRSEVESPNGYLSECNNVNLLVVILREKKQKQKKNNHQKTAKQGAGERGLCCCYVTWGPSAAPGQGAVCSQHRHLALASCGVGRVALVRGRASPPSLTSPRAP